MNDCFLRCCSFLCLIALTAVCCKSASYKSSMCGEYIKEYKPKKGYREVISLTINKDSTFRLTDKWFEVNSECVGSWRFISKNAILLKCFDDTTILGHLEMGYMDQRKWKLIIIDRGKIKLGKSILRLVEK